MSLEEYKSVAGTSILLEPGEGKTITAAGSSITIKVPGEATGGAWSLTEFSLPANWSDQAPPPHVHTREDESFYVMEGTVTFQLGDRIFKGAPGSFVFGPKGIVHKFSNPEPEPAKLLVISSPAGLEHFFEELYELLKNNPTDLGPIIALFEKYGMQVQPPPNA